MLKKTLMCVMLIGLMACPVVADSIVITGATDVDDSYFGSEGWLNHGGAGYMYVNTGNRILMRFNVSEVVIPDNAINISATMTVKYDAKKTSQTGNLLIDMYKMVADDADWVEGSQISGNEVGAACWNKKVYGQSSSWHVDWATGPGWGTLLSTTPVGSQTAVKDTSTGGLSYTVWELNYSGDAVTSMVLNWVNGTEANGGVLLASNTADAGSVYMYSSDFLAHHPSLTISYDVVPEPVTIGLLMVGGIAGLVRRKKY